MINNEISIHDINLKEEKPPHVIIIEELEKQKIDLKLKKRKTIYQINYDENEKSILVKFENNNYRKL